MSTAKQEFGSPAKERDENKAVVPGPVLNTLDAFAIIIGIVIGAGIFRTPSLVANSVASGEMMLLVWLLGGAVSIIGALCYAELTTTFPNTGGDYHFLMEAFGKRTAFLFAWARMSVIQTGSIALLAFIFGDYASQIFKLGEYSEVVYAALLVCGLTMINVAGIKIGSGTQKFLTTVEVLGILTIVVVGFFLVPEASATSFTSNPESGNENSFGLAMVFVLLTFGGWNEAAYLSAEISKGKRRIAVALIAGILTITLIYFLVNMAFLRGLGLEGMVESNALAGDLLGVAFGQTGIVIISLLVAIAALTSANATIFTGARSNYALGRDFSVFSFLGKWRSRIEGPVNALLIQSGIALVLVSFGLFSRSGFETMIEYTAPVFWFFLLLVGISLFILRKKQPLKKRPFKVPLYPVLPIIFCFSSAYLLYSSIMYTGWGALAGIGVLMAGALFLLFKPSVADKKNFDEKKI